MELMWIHAKNYKLHDLNLWPNFITSIFWAPVKYLWFQVFKFTPFSCQVIKHEESHNGILPEFIVESQVPSLQITAQEN
jgi:hypothetical protein